MPEDSSEPRTGADYLAQFSESPYQRPGRRLQRVEGISTLRGSWIPKEG